MLTGATKLLGPIATAHLDPFLLAQSQADNVQGYILITYQPPQGPRMFDVLFLHGPNIYDVIALHEHRRTRSDLKQLQQRYAMFRKTHQVSVSLYQADESVTGPFIEALTLDTLLKIPLQGFSSRKQLHHLLASVSVINALIERSDFSAETPMLEFQEVDRSTTPLAWSVGAKKGWLTVYSRESCALLTPQPELPALIQKAGSLGTQRPVREGSDDLFSQTNSTKEKRLPEDAAFVRVFEDLLATFRQHLQECYGTHSAALMDRAEKKVRLNNAGFSASSLTASTAPFVVHLLEAAVAEATFIKRKKVKEIVAGLLAEVFKKHCELLEQHGVLDKVEEAYYRVSG